MRLNLRSTGFLLLVCLFLTACGATTSPAPTGPQPGTPPASSGGAPSPDDAELGGKALIDAAKKEGKVVVYTGQTINQAKSLSEAFSKQFPEIKVEVVRKGGGELHELLSTEAEAKKLRADVVEQTDIGLLMSWNKKYNLLESHTPPSDALYEDAYKVKAQIYPTFLILHGIVYNTQLVAAADAPKSWKDLLNPKFKDRVIVTAPSGGGCSWSRVLFEGKILGESYWQDLANQNPRISVSNAQMIQTIISGQNMVATMLDSVAAEPAGKGAPVKMVYPTEGVAPCYSAAGVIKQAGNPNAAKLYLNWLLSEKGQTVWVKELSGFSLRKGMPSPPGAPPVSEIKIYPFNREDFTSLHDEWVKKWNRIFKYTA